MSGAGIEFVLARKRQNINAFLLFGVYKNITIKSSWKYFSVLRITKVIIHKIQRAYFKYYEEIIPRHTHKSTRVCSRVRSGNLLDYRLHTLNDWRVWKNFETKGKTKIETERTLEVEWWNKTKWRAENSVQYVNKEMNRLGRIQSKNEWMNEWRNKKN